MFKSKWFGDFAAFVKKRNIRRLSWYAGLALLLTALGMASYGFRNRAAVRYERRETAPEAPIAAMAGATASPSEWLTALPTPAPAPTPEPLVFCWPVTGEIVGSYAPDALVWSETLSQWENHPALDIAAATGEAVSACAAGVVSDAWDDPLWGKTIEIEHAGGYVSTYANLSTLALVNVGDAVSAGQTISAVGHTALCEAEMSGHLHFALSKDGETVDFEKIVRQIGA